MHGSYAKCTDRNAKCTDRYAKCTVRYAKCTVRYAKCTVRYAKCTPSECRLSLDIITASVALLSDGGRFGEIGKRAIWARPRYAASAPRTTYRAIALDWDTAHNPCWMHGVLGLLTERSQAAIVTSLPLVSFDMPAQHTLAFRTLQRGVNTGRVVLRVAAQSLVASGGSHIVSGGTTALELLSARSAAACPRLEERRARGRHGRGVTGGAGVWRGGKCRAVRHSRGGTLPPAQGGVASTGWHMTRGGCAG